MKAESIQKLAEILEAEVPALGLRMIYTNLFALGCYLHAQGHRESGYKFCSQVLSELGFNRRKTYFSAILNSLDGNELNYALGIGANHEVLEPLRRLNRSAAE